MPTNKKRLDRAVVETGLVESRQRAQAMIMEGRILVNNQPIDKPGNLDSIDDQLFFKGNDNPYVSRG